MANEYPQTVFMVGADEDGKVQTFNIGMSDDTYPIFFELETQELEFGNRAHLKKIANEVVVFCQFGAQSTFQAKSDEADYKPIPVDLSGTVNIGQNINLEGHFLTFKWMGETATASPVFEGFYLEDVSDMGMTHG